MINKSGFICEIKINSVVGATIGRPLALILNRFRRATNGRPYGFVAIAKHPDKSKFTTHQTTPEKAKTVSVRRFCNSFFIVKILKCIFATLHNKVI